MKRGISAALTLGAAAAVVLFATIVLVVYKMRPTPGTAILILGWMSILAAGYFLVRSVNSIGAAHLTFDALSGGRHEELEREKRNLLKAIKEVEFDRDTGKLESGEAQAAIGRYRAKALDILRLLDEDPERRYEGVVEEELARRMAADAGSPSCAACGADNDEDAAFCKKCGVKLGARS